MAEGIEPTDKKTLSRIVGKINGRIQAGSLPYKRISYLLSPLIPDTLLSCLNGKDPLLTIFNNTLKGRVGGPAKFWYVLKETGSCPDDLLEELRKLIPDKYVIPNEMLPKLHLRRLILKMVSALANDTVQASSLINTVGTDQMNPPVLLENLVRDPATLSDYTQPLMVFFEKAEQQGLVTPTNLSDLREWIEEAGHLDVVERYHLDQPLAMEKVVIQSGKRPPLTAGTNDSVEEEKKPCDGESQLVNGTRQLCID